MELQDSLELKQSSIINLPSAGKSNVNLQLEAAPNLLSATVSGTVYDTTLLGTVLGGATVTVFGTDGTIVAFATTSLLGLYAISGLEAGKTYTIVASKDGYTTSAASSFTGNLLIPSVVNLVISPNSNETLNTVFGIVRDQDDVAIDGAVVSLTDKTTGETFSTTESIVDGEYAIYNVPTGTYSLTTSKTGFMTSVVDNIALTTSQKSVQDVSLEEDSTAGNANISGIITDNNSDPVANAFVGLYTLNTSDEPETLVDYTFTNAAGRYVFGNIAPNSYIVKAKLSINS